MRNRVARGVLGGIIILGTSWLAIAGCSSSSSGDSSTTQDASLACPVTVVSAVGASCPVNGQDCPIGYTCGSFAEQAHCVCSNGKFACTDATNQAVDKTAGPQCVGNGTGNEAECPATEKLTGGKPCKTAGLICSYLGLVCGSAPPLIDQCQCVGNADGGALVFACEPKSCTPGTDASLPDTNPPPPPPDAGDAGEDG